MGGILVRHAATVALLFSDLQTVAIVQIYTNNKVMIYVANDVI